jgi:exosortase A-associated hydrolase 2
MMEEAGFFRHNGFRLFAVLHAPDANHARPTVGVVVCHPFGEERQFTDHVMVRLARRLAGAGFAVLRFDRRGYGESDGDLRDATVDTMIGETCAAASLLRERLGVEHVVLLGLRWGATVAALTAEHDASVSGLVLWSPVVSGAAYGNEIMRRRIFAQLANQEGRVTTAQLLAALRRERLLEFEGDYLTPQLFDDMSAATLPPRTTSFERPVLVGTIRRPGAEDPCHAVVASYRARGAAADLVAPEGQEYWDDRSMFDGVVPEALVAATLDWLRRHGTPH